MSHDIKVFDLTEFLKTEESENYRSHLVSGDSSTTDISKTDPQNHEYSKLSERSYDNVEKKEEKSFVSKFNKILLENIF